jgi:hypothetical protein
MDTRCRGVNQLELRDEISPIFQASAKAENLLITKGELLDFSLPKAENILKTSQL